MIKFAIKAEAEVLESRIFRTDVCPACGKTIYDGEPVVITLNCSGDSVKMDYFECSQCSGLAEKDGDE